MNADVWPFHVLAGDHIARARAALATGDAWTVLYWTRSAVFWQVCEVWRRQRAAEAAKGQV